MPNKNAPKKNKIISAYRKTLPRETETGNNYNSEESIKRNPGESNGDYYHRQKAENEKAKQNTEKPQKDSLVQRGKNYANDKINRAKEYGGQKGKETLEKGAKYAKGIGQEFLDKNPKVIEKINRAKEAKENFENRMSGMKENIQSPDNIEDRSIKSVLGQRLKTGINKRIGKTLENNPQAAAAAARANEIKKQVALKAQKFSNRVKELSRKAKIANARLKEIKKQLDLDIKQRIKDEIKRYAIRLLWPAISGALLILAKLIAVVLITVVIIAALKYTCESNPLFDMVCSTAVNIAL